MARPAEARRGECLRLSGEARGKQAGRVRSCGTRTCGGKKEAKKAAYFTMWCDLNHCGEWRLNLSYIKDD